MNPCFYRNIVKPLYHWLKGGEELKFLRETRKIQWMSAEDLIAMQNYKLEKLLKHTYKNVPYYRKLFRNMGLKSSNLLSHFREIPPLTKSDIRQNLRKLCSMAQDNSKRLISSSTSGSTGEKLRFFYDRLCSYHRKAIVYIDWEALGVLQGERIARLWGAPMDLKMAKRLRGRLHSKITNQTMLSTYQMSDQSFNEYLKTLKKFKPILLISYPTPLVTFCNFLRKEKYFFPSLKAVVTSAETLFPWQREIIEETLKCQVYNRYGSREFGDIAHEFPCQNGLHVHTNRFILEILDDNLQAVRPGHAGEIYVTDLDNFGMPFLRYRTGDVGSWAKSQNCTCGRGWPLLSNIEGRSFDVVVASNGNRIGGTFWTILFKQFPGIQHFQLHQLEYNKIIIRYVLDPKFEELPKNSIEYWVQQIAVVCGDKMVVEFMPIKKVEQTISGKTRIVISEVSHLE